MSRFNFVHRPSRGRPATPAIEQRFPSADERPDNSSRQQPPFEPRFPECRDCKNFHPKRPTPPCLRCGAGEFFEEAFNEKEPSEIDLIKMMKEWSNEE